MAFLTREQFNFISRGAVSHLVLLDKDVACSALCEVATMPKNYQLTYRLLPTSTTPQPSVLPQLMYVTNSMSIPCVAFSNIHAAKEFMVVEITKHIDQISKCPNISIETFKKLINVIDEYELVLDKPTIRELTYILEALYIDRKNKLDEAYKPLRTRVFAMLGDAEIEYAKD